MDNDLVFAFVRNRFTPIARHNTTIAYGTPVMGTHLISSSLGARRPQRNNGHPCPGSGDTCQVSRSVFFSSGSILLAYPVAHHSIFCGWSPHMLTLLSLKNLPTNPLFNTMVADPSPRIVYSLGMPSFWRLRRREAYDHGAAGRFKPAYRLDPACTLSLDARRIAKPLGGKSRSHGSNRCGLQAMPA